jgi:hypothetical protein
MNYIGDILIITIICISLYDFYVLKKSKVKTLSCLSSLAITLVANLVIIFIGLLIGSAIFGNDNNNWIFISLISVIGISYFRFRGREIIKGKVKEKTPEKVKKRSLKENIIDVSTALGGILFYKLFGLLGLGGLGIGYGVYTYLNNRYNIFVSVIAGIVAGIVGYLLIAFIYFEFK